MPDCIGCTNFLLKTPSEFSVGEISERFECALTYSLTSRVLDQIHLSLPPRTHRAEDFPFSETLLGH
jgi:hypothetical protein